VLKLPETPRTIEGVDIAHLGGDETVASLVQFIDGLPFKRVISGIGFAASRASTTSNRFTRSSRAVHRLREEGQLFPDVLLIDGGKGQLSAAMALFGVGDHAPDRDLAGQARGRDFLSRTRKNRFVSAGMPMPCAFCNTSATKPTASAQHYHKILRHKARFDEETGAADYDPTG